MAEPPTPTPPAAPRRPRPSLLHRKLDELYRRSGEGGAATRALLRGIAAGVLAGASLPVALMILFGLVLGLFWGAAHLIGLSQREGFFAGFSIPWRIAFENGYVELFGRYVLRLAGGGVAGILLASPFLLRDLPWLRRIRLLAGLLGWALVLLWVPGFALLFAAGFPFLLRAGLRRWATALPASTAVLVLLPSVGVLTAVQVGGPFAPLRWVDPLAELGGVTPRERWRQDDEARQVRQAADAGQAWALNLSLQRPDLDPARRMRYLRALRMTPGCRTPEREREYRDWVVGHLRLPPGMDDPPAGLVGLLVEDGLLSDPSITEAAAVARIRLLADYWHELRPRDPRVLVQ